MSRIQYSVQTDPETTSKAIGHELHISPKHCREICIALEGMKTDKAMIYV